MYLAILIPSFEKGGIERSISRISRELIKLGWKIDFLVIEVNPEIRNFIQDVNLVYLSNNLWVKVLKVFFPRVIFLNVVSFLGLIRYIKREKPDTLLTARNALLGVFVKYFSKGKTKIVIREPLHISSVVKNSSGVIRKLSPIIKKFIYKKADKVIAISEGVADDLIRNFDLTTEKVKVIYNPSADPEIKIFGEENVNHPWIREKIPVIIGIGRLTKQKDFPTLINAFAIAREKRPCKLMIIGEGDERKNIEHLISKLPIGEDIKLMGYKSNPWKYLSKSNLLVMTSLWEGLGNVIIEAMYLGIPVISTDCPSGPRELLDEGYLGDLVPIQSPELLANKIIGFLDNPHGYRNRVLKAEKESLKFSPRKIAEAYSKELTNLHH